MSIAYELRINNAQGIHRKTLTLSDAPQRSQIESMQIGWKESDVSKLTLEIPTEALGNLAPLISRDWQIEVWRSVDGRSPTLVASTLWLVLRKLRIIRNGVTQLKIEAYSLNVLLRRRIIAYPSGTSYTEKQGFADDVIKAFARENFGILANIARYWPQINISPDRALGGFVRIEAARKQLLEVMRDCAEASYTDGTYVAFDLTWDPSGGYLFDTYIGQRGADHRFPNGANGPLLIPESSLEDIEIDENWIEEANYIYAVGKGSGDARPVQIAQDPTRSGASIFGRIERVQDVSNVAHPDALAAEAAAALEQGRPRLGFKARLRDASSLRFGVDFNGGDLISSQALGRTFTTRLEAYGLQMQAGRPEKVDLRFEVETTL